MNIEKLEKLIKKIEFIIKNTEFENHVFLVGGCVRDSVMDKTEINDIDIVVDLENGGINLANYIAKLDGSYQQDNNPLVFNEYKTAFVHMKNDEEFNDVELEFVETRKEKYKDGSRNPYVEFGTIEDDAYRRDLTINALYYDISKSSILDPTGMGINDIENEIIRATTDPNLIYEQDPLRILRAIRFSTKFGWGIEKNTWLGMMKHAEKVLTISQERITNEINKILLSDKPSIGFEKLSKCNGLLEMVLPGLHLLKSLNQTINTDETVYDHTLRVIDSSKPFLANRLAAMYHDIGKLATFKNGFINHEKMGVELTRQLMKEQRYPNSVINKVICAVQHHGMLKGYNSTNLPKNKIIREILVECGDNLELVLDTIHADNINQAFGKKAKQVENFKAKIASLMEKEELHKEVTLPINGNDIIKEFNLKPSPLIGKLLNNVKDAYFCNPSITKEECFKLIKATLELTV